MKREVFEKYRPTVVFHAAAHKHVPMMEAIRSRRSRTTSSARAFAPRCSAEAVSSLVMISTDKAVNPTR